MHHAFRFHLTGLPRSSIARGFATRVLKDLLRGIERVRWKAQLTLGAFLKGGLRGRLSSDCSPLATTTHSC
jgi:hypothetical protein